MGNRRTATTRDSGGTGSSDPVGHRKTVRFALDGVEYEVDLAPEDAAELRAILSEYADKGRRTAPRRSRTSSGTPAAPPARSEPDVRRIRQWAEEHGHSPNARGRLPQAIIDAYGKR